MTVEEISAPTPYALATGPFGSSISAKHFLTTGVPVIRGSNLSPEVSIRLIDTGLVYLSSDKAAEFKRSIVRRGDLVFTCWGTINQVGLIDERSRYEFYVISNKQMKLTIDPAKADVRFVYYVFSSPEKQSEIIENGIGSSVPGFNLGQLKKHKIRLPPLEEQREIAVFLECLDDRITLLRETNKTLEAIAQAIFKSWFVDFDPVRAKMEGRQPEGMDEETAALFPHHFEELPLGSAPRGWQIKSLDKIADYLNGLALQKFPPTGSNDLPIIKIAQLRKGETDKNALAAGSIKPEYVVQDGDILFSWSGSLEVEIWCGGYGALNQHLFKVTSAEHPKWFYYLWTRHHLPSFRHIAESKATTMGHIQRKHLSEATAAVPCSGVLEKANEIFEPLINLQIGNAQQARTLTALRDALLPRLISGQLRLPDAQEQVENALS